MPERIPCRCLLRDAADQRPLHAIIADAVEALPEEQRATAETYEMRLAHCRDCAQLWDGTCALCGCYVELRAAKRRMGCPRVPPCWHPEIE